MSTTHITPTPGRIVWYRGADGATRPAIVIKGNGPFNADLYVFPLNATDTDWGTKATVTHADPEQEPGCLQSWHWMPYQKQQAEKHATEAARADEPKACTAGDSSRDQMHMRYDLISLAARMPGVSGYHDVLRAAAAYHAHIVGEAEPTANQQPAPGAAHPGYTTMQPHQQRVVDEKAELDGRLEKLVAFTKTPIFAGLDSDERNRLDQQAATMAMYSDILGDRIDAFASATAA